MEDLSESTSGSDGQIQYITYNQHNDFMQELESELVAICKQDPVLRETVPLLESCSNDCQFNDQFVQFLNSKVDCSHGRALHLKITLLDGESCDAYVPASGSVLDLRGSIERSIAMRAQRMGRQEGGRKQKWRGPVEWERVWRKYDLWLDRSQRLCMRHQNAQPTPDDILPLTSHLSDTIIGHHSTIEFIPKRS